MTIDPNRASSDDQEDGPPDPLQVLTDNQKNALRLAHEGLSAGEIAVRLNLRTKAAANDRIWEARQKLGGVSKRDAGRMLVEAEQRVKTAEIGQTVADPYPVLPDPQPLWMASSPDPGERAAAADVGGELREERAPLGPFVATRFGEDDPAPRLGDVLRYALYGLAILVLVKPTIDGFEWFYKAVSSPFMWRGDSNEQAAGIDGCGSAPSGRYKRQPGGGDKNRSHDSGLFRTSAQNRCAAGRGR